MVLIKKEWDRVIKIEKKMKINSTYGSKLEKINNHQHSNMLFYPKKF